MSFDPIEEIHAALVRLRQNPTTKKKFPSETWDAIIQLTKTHSHKEICRRLQLNPSLLKRKIRQSAPVMGFREISFQNIPSDTVVIELISKKGMKAKIQGPLSCLNCLQQLLGG